jgi:predicted Zn-dependent peptidase
VGEREIISLLEEYFRGWRGGRLPLPAPVAPPAINKMMVIKID